MNIIKSGIKFIRSLTSIAKKIRKIPIPKTSIRSILYLIPISILLLVIILSVWLSKIVTEPVQKISTFSITIAIVIIIIPILIVLSRSKLDIEKYLFHNVTILIFGICFIHWLLSVLCSKFWLYFWDNQKIFWTINIGIFFAIILLFKKGSDGKTSTLTLNMSRIIGAIVAMIFLVSTIYFVKNNWESMFTDLGFRKESQAVAKRTKIKFGDIPLEIARKVICECESGCSQFEKDPKTGEYIKDANGNKVILRNKGIPKYNIPPSSAFGKYQFIEAHRSVAGGLGFDLDTEEGQDKYFEYVFNKNGFGPWDFDEEYGGGRGCWGPKLAQMGYDVNIINNNVLARNSYELLIEARVDKPSRKIQIPEGMYFSITSDGPTKITDNKGEEVFYGVEGKISNLSYPSSYLQFESMGSKDNIVKIVFNRKPFR